MQTSQIPKQQQKNLNRKNNPKTPKEIHCWGCQDDDTVLDP